MTHHLLDIVDELRNEAIFDPVRQKAADEIIALRKCLHTQVEAICRAVCGVEGVDPDSDVYGDSCDPQWARYADAVAAALLSTGTRP